MLKLIIKTVLDQILQSTNINNKTKSDANIRYIKTIKSQSVHDTKPTYNSYDEHEHGMVKNILPIRLLVNDCNLFVSTYRHQQ